MWENQLSASTTTPARLNFGIQLTKNIFRITCGKAYLDSSTREALRESFLIDGSKNQFFSNLNQLYIHPKTPVQNSRLKFKNLQKIWILVSHYIAQPVFGALDLMCFSPRYIYFSQFGSLHV